MINLKYPPVIHWEVTPECNHKCIHCYNYWRTDKDNLICKTFKKSKNFYLKMAKIISELKPTTVVITRRRTLISY